MEYFRAVRSRRKKCNIFMPYVVVRKMEYFHAVRSRPKMWNAAVFLLLGLIFRLRAPG